jgi:hypothetical protein
MGSPLCKRETGGSRAPRATIPRGSFILPVVQTVVQRGTENFSSGSKHGKNKGFRVFRVSVENVSRPRLLAGSPHYELLPQNGAAAPTVIRPPGVAIHRTLPAHRESGSKPGWLREPFGAVPASGKYTARGQICPAGGANRRTEFIPLPQHANGMNSVLHVLGSDCGATSILSGSTVSTSSPKPRRCGRPAPGRPPARSGCFGSRRRSLRAVRRGR